MPPQVTLLALVVLAADPNLLDTMGVLDVQKVSVQEMDRGMYVTWTVSGPVTIRVRQQAGFNAVISAVFVDTP